MKRPTFALVAALLFLASLLPAGATPPPTTHVAVNGANWFETFGNSDTDGVRAVLFDGQYIYVAMETAMGTETWTWVAKLDAATGAPVWEKYITTGSIIIPSRILFDGSWVYLVGYAAGFLSTWYDAFVAKLDPSTGDVLGFLAIDTGGNAERPRDAVLLGGDIYLVGHVFTTTEDVLVMRIDPSNMSVVWTRIIQTPGFDIGYGIASDGTLIYIAGYTDAFSATGVTEGFVATLDPLTGNLNAFYTVSSGAGDFVFDLAYYNGLLYIGGDTSYDPTYIYGLVAALDPATWSLVWSVGIGPEATVYSVMPTTSGLYVGGESDADLDAFYDVFMARLNSTGGVELFKQVGGGDDEFAGDFDVAPPTLVLAGETWSYLDASGWSEGFVARIDETFTGTLAWTGGETWAAVSVADVAATQITVPLTVTARTVSAAAVSVTTKYVGGSPGINYSPDDQTIYFEPGDPVPPYTLRVSGHDFDPRNVTAGVVPQTLIGTITVRGLLAAYVNSSVSDPTSGLLTVDLGAKALVTMDVVYEYFFQFGEAWVELQASNDSLTWVTLLSAGGASSATVTSQYSSASRTFTLYARFIRMNVSVASYDPAQVQEAALYLDRLVLKFPRPEPSTMGGIAAPLGLLPVAAAALPLLALLVLRLARR